LRSEWQHGITAAAEPRKVRARVRVRVKVRVRVGVGVGVRVGVTARRRAREHCVGQRSAGVHGRKQHVWPRDDLVRVSGQGQGQG
jgi:hypothetical protein